MRVIFSAEQAASSLWDYGEDELVDQALAFSESDLRELWAIAGVYWDPEYLLPVIGQKVTLNHVSALAAVTFLEGELRPLAQERRRPQKLKPERLRNPQPVPPSTAT